MKKKILFIEDEFNLQTTLGEFLRKEGYEVVSALDGEAGLRMAKKEKPDLILLDLILPKKHGLDVLKELKDNEETKDIPVIIFTNLETANDVQKALELGANTYLVKANYSLDDIARKIRNQFEERK